MKDILVPVNWQSPEMLSEGVRWTIFNVHCEAEPKQFNAHLHPNGK